MESEKAAKREELDAVAIVIVTYNSSRTIASCLLSLLEHVPERSISKIVVIDNASTDGTLDLLARLQAQFPIITTLRLPTNVGFGSACNEAFRSEPAGIYVLVNPDCRVIGNSLFGLAEYFRRHRDVAVVGLPLVNQDGSPQSSAFDFSSWQKWLLQLLGAPPLARGLLALPMVGTLIQQLSFGAEYARIHSRQRLDLGSSPSRAVPPRNPRSVDWVTGAAMALRGEFVVASGGFDKGIFLYGEDEDICLAAHSAGWRVVAVDTIPFVHELGWLTNRYDERVAVRKYESLSYFIRKHYGSTMNGQLMQLILPLHVFGWSRALRRLLHR